MGAVLCSPSIIMFLTLRRWKGFVQWILLAGGVCPLSERRRRGIFVAPKTKPTSSPSGATYSEDFAPDGAWEFVRPDFLQRCRAYGAERRAQFVISSAAPAGADDFLNAVSDGVAPANFQQFSRLPLAASLHSPVCGYNFLLHKPVPTANRSYELIDCDHFKGYAPMFPRPFARKVCRFCSRNRFP